MKENSKIKNDNLKNNYFVGKLPKYAHLYACFFVISFSCASESSIFFQFVFVLLSETKSFLKSFLASVFSIVSPMFKIMFKGAKTAPEFYLWSGRLSGSVAIQTGNPNNVKLAK